MIHASFKTNHLVPLFGLDVAEAPLIENGWFLEKNSQWCADRAVLEDPCWLMIIGGYTGQYIGDNDNPTGESLLTNQD